eukprot:189857_1
MCPSAALLLGGVMATNPSSAAGAVACGVCPCCSLTAPPLEELRLIAKATLLPQLKRTPYVKNMMRSLRTMPPNATGGAQAPGGGEPSSAAAGGEEEE